MPPLSYRAQPQSEHSTRPSRARRDHHVNWSLVEVHLGPNAEVGGVVRAVSNYIRPFRLPRSALNRVSWEKVGSGYSDLTPASPPIRPKRMPALGFGTARRGHCRGGRTVNPDQAGYARHARSRRQSEQPRIPARRGRTPAADRRPVRRGNLARRCGIAEHVAESVGDELLQDGEPSSSLTHALPSRDSFRCRRTTRRRRPSPQQELLRL